MEEKNLICIGCPMGCPLTVKMENGEVVSVTGNTCKRGDIYARKSWSARCVILFCRPCGV